MTRLDKPTVRVPLAELHATRGNRDLGDVSSLRDSMQQLGQLAPLLVTAREEGGFRVIAGHRRRAAALLLRLPDLECKVLDGAQLDLVHVADNELREGLSLSEKSDLAAELLKRHPLAEAAKAFGKTPNYVRRLARMRLEFPELVWDRLVAAGKAARSDDWLQLLALPVEQQILRSALNGKKPKMNKTRRIREIEAMILRLPARDMRGQVLRWVLKQCDFPGKCEPTHSALAP